MMAIEVSVLFGAVGALIGVLGLIVAYKKETKSEGETFAQTSAQLSFITEKITDIRKEQKVQANKIESLSERLIRMEEALKKTIGK